MSKNKLKKTILDRLVISAIILGIVNIIITFYLGKKILKKHLPTTEPKAALPNQTEEFYTKVEEEFDYQLKELYKFSYNTSPVSLSPLMKKIKDQIYFVYKSENKDRLNFLLFKDEEIIASRSIQFANRRDVYDIGRLNRAPVVLYTDITNPISPGSPIYYSGVFVKNINTEKEERISDPYTNNSFAILVDNNGVLYSSTYYDKTTQQYKINRLVFAYKEKGKWVKKVLDKFVYPSSISPVVYKNNLFVAFESMVWVLLFPSNYRQSSVTPEVDKYLNLLYSSTKPRTGNFQPFNWVFKSSPNSNKLTLIPNPFFQEENGKILLKDTSKTLKDTSPRKEKIYYLIGLPVITYARFDLIQKEWKESKIISENVALTIKKRFPFLSQLPHSKIIGDKLKIVWSDSRGRVRSKTVPGMGRVFFPFTSNVFGRNMDLKTFYFSPEFKVTRNGYVFIEQPIIGTLNLESNISQIVANKYNCVWNTPWCPSGSMYLGIERKFESYYLNPYKDAYKKTLMFTYPFQPIVKIFEADNGIYYLQQKIENNRNYLRLLKITLFPKSKHN